MEYRYSAIVLKKREVRETDRLYTFYTREAGKLQAMAKGVRRSEAKLAGTLETLSLVDLMVVRTRGVGKVAGAVLEENFALWRGQYAVLASILEAFAVFDRLVDFEERDEHLFDLLRQLLETGESLIRMGKEEKIPMVVEAFLFQLSAHLGYRLELGFCVETGTKLRSGEPLALSPSAGGVVMGESISRLRDALPVSENAVKLLRLFSSQPLGKLGRLSITSYDFAEIVRFRKIFFQWIRR